MKTYTADRLETGCEIYVTQDGKSRPLSLHLEIRNHSPTGFEWGYRGSGCAQLALAILADHLGPLRPPEYCPYCESPMDGNNCTAKEECGYDFSKEDQWAEVQQWYQRFKEDVIAKLSKDKWSITEEEIDKWRANIMEREGHE